MRVTHPDISDDQPIRAVEHRWTRIDTGGHVPHPLPREAVPVLDGDPDPVVVIGQPVEAKIDFGFQLDCLGQRMRLDGRFEIPVVG